ncbi:MAG TPA: quinoprotein dehydrogenase-associated putative ABC transporter substrate-binding protein [Rhizomicrobium sp.]
MRIKALIPALFALVPLAAQAGVLRVCSEPNNLPFSNSQGQGFENRIADLVARDMGDMVAYTYALQNDKFIKHTLDAGKCDVMMGVSAGMDDVLTTHPYYASTYVFVSRKADALGLASLTDPRLRKLKIGVHLIGDDSTPPAIALGQEGIVDNIKGYMIYGDFSKPNPPARLIEAVENKDVDIAAAWGPLGGYFAKSSPVALSVTPITDTARFKPLLFTFAIAMGVKKGNVALRNKLDGVIAKEQPAIRNILQSYGVPLVDLKGASNG